MARYTYRVFGETDWLSSSGSGLVAITNALGSGKRLTVTQFEIYNETRLSRMQTLETQVSLPTTIGVWFCSSLGSGDTLTPAALDPQASWGSTLQCSKGAAYVVDTSRNAIASPARRVGVVKNMNLTTILAYRKNSGSKEFNFGNICNRQINTDLQAITVAAGEKVVLAADGISANIPLLVELQLRVTGSPNRTYQVSYFTNLATEGNSLFALDNPVGSGVSVYVDDIRISEAGTYDTPYFQFVPISIVDGASYSDTSRKIAVTKIDTDSPDLSSSTGQVFFNVPIYPAQGIPFEYIAPGSPAGAPKGFNYLHSKDFIGPVYGAYLLEAAPIRESGATANVTSTTFGAHLSMKMSGLGKAPITIREGEGVALTSGAERADTGLGMSGWQNYKFGFTLTVENLYSPFLTVSGFQSGSDVTVLRSSNQTVVSEQFDIVGSSFSWGYDRDSIDTVDICVYREGYIPWTIRNVSLGAQGTSVPVQQVADRNYTT